MLLSIIYTRKEYIHKKESMQTGIVGRLNEFTCRFHSGKSATIQLSNHGSGVCKQHYVYYYVLKSSILLAGTGVWKISSVACGFSSIKIDYSDYPKSLISRINEVHVFFFFNKISL